MSGTTAKGACQDSGKFNTFHGNYPLKNICSWDKKNEQKVHVEAAELIWRTGLHRWKRFPRQTARFKFGIIKFAEGENVENKFSSLIDDSEDID